MRIGPFSVFLAILLAFSVSCAAVIESGDNGLQFAEDTSQALCQEENVSAVYICNGNVVRADSAVSGEGSTFYRPDGSLVHCPDVAPPEMGAQCLQMMIPNFCPQESVCGETPPREFPGQEEVQEEAEQENQTEQIPEYAAEEEETAEPQPEPEEYAPPVVEENDVVTGEDIPVAAPASHQSVLGNLSWAILLLGMASVGVLFMLFKKSINEEV
ncbi:hypothetical protein GF318_06030 [Candidatus Micrarchaeota archaeon]|nr:hypothetical protein [Candidatus Micrarchaeota archaeon]